MRRTVPVFAACLAATANASSEEDVNARLNVEAKLLFTQLIKDRDRPITTCEIEPKWSDYGIPYEIAHSFLGLTIHANLQNIDGVQTPAQVLVAAGAPKDDICDDAARDRYVMGAIATLKATYKAEAKPGARGFYSYKTAYSFPAFNSGFKRAIVISVSTAFPHFLDETGALKRTTLEGGSRAETYRRGDRGWRRVETIEMSNWD